MRFMAIVKATEDSAGGALPGEDLLAAKATYNEGLVKAGVLLAADRLQASSRGMRVRFSEDTRTVIDGPFAETKELIAGFWTIQVTSKEEAVEGGQALPKPP